MPALTLAPKGDQSHDFILAPDQGCWIDTGDLVVRIWRGKGSINVEAIDCRPTAVIGENIIDAMTVPTD